MKDSKNEESNVWIELVELVTSITDESEVNEQIKNDIENYLNFWGDFYDKCSIENTTIKDIGTFLKFYTMALKAFHLGCYDKYSSIFDEWLDKSRIIQYAIMKKHSDENFHKYYNEDDFKALCDRKDNNNGK